MTATFSILFFDSGDDDTLDEEALSDHKQEQWRDQCHQGSRLNQLRSLAIDTVEGLKCNGNWPCLAVGGEVDQWPEKIIPGVHNVED